MRSSSFVPFVMRPGLGPGLALALALALLAGWPPAARAEWAITQTPVPVKRLIDNITAHLDENPDDAHGWYVLGRVHSMAFAYGTEELRVVQDDAEGQGAPAGRLPGFGQWETVRVSPNEGAQLEEAVKQRKEHLRESARCYHKSTQLDSEQPLPQLGLGWVLEQGSKVAAKVGAPPTAEYAEVDETKQAAAKAEVEKLVAKLGAVDPDEREAAQRALEDRIAEAAQVLADLEEQDDPEIRERVGRLLAYAWQEAALAAYRRAYELTVEADLKAESAMHGGDELVSHEAAQGILRILEARGVGEAEREEVARLKEVVAKLNEVPRWITPIIFPLDRPRPLADLLESGKTVRFDLDGTGPAAWPWVKGDTGILVWDPQGTGKIESGLQLFGSVTWWIHWDDGYQPLALLDDDGDGSLSGEELAGLAVWRDVDGDAVSDAGEVESVSALGIERLAARAAGLSDGVSFNSAGVSFADGACFPSYDWTPAGGIPAPAKADAEGERASPAK